MASDRQSSRKAQNHSNQHSTDLSSSRGQSDRGRSTARESSLGNQAMQNMLRAGAIQAKLNVGREGGQYEQEADRIAQQVATSPASSTRDRSISKPTSKSSGQQTAGLDLGPGRPLDAASRNFMESRFGSDFSDVRVHAGEEAARSAESINARAYTLGKEVVFGQGQYAPQTQSGKQLLAHELTHVLQQSGDPRQPTQVSHSRNLPSHSVTPLASSGTIQRKGLNTLKPLLGKGEISEVNFDASAILSIQGGRGSSTNVSKGEITSLTVPADSKGIVDVRVVMLIRTNDGAFPHLEVAHMQTAFTTTPEGELSLSGFSPATPRESTNPGLYVLRASGTQTTTGAGGTVQLTPSIDATPETRAISGTNSTSNTDSSSHQVGGGVDGEKEIKGVKAKGGGRYTYTTGSSKTKTESKTTSVSTPTTGKWSENFVVDITVNIPKKPKPPEAATYSTSILFPFDVSDVSEDDKGKIIAFYYSLPLRVKDSIKTGATKIQITGFASESGTWDYNQRLSGERATAVKQVFADSNLSGDLGFSVDAFGEVKQTPDPSEQRVDINVIYQPKEVVGE